MRDEACVVVEVGVPPSTAFEVFTSEASAWWQRDRSLWGPGSTGAVRFEPGVGGRLLLNPDQSTMECEVGRISVWEPGPRLVFSYGPPGSADQQRTEVEVRFETTESGTRVVLHHRGWTEHAGGDWAAALAGFARHSTERMLLARLGEFLDAIAKNDVAFIETNLTDDAVLIFPGRDNTYTKAQCLAAIANHQPYTQYDLAESRIVRLDAATAVLTHRATGYNAAHPRPFTVTVSSVLVHDDGAWRLALLQWTPAD
ncbi:MAG: DUF4440 domain-containing protein [Labedaea sp.]